MEDGDNAVYNVGMDEFQPPTPMQVRYCSKLTEDEFHEQGTCETEKALKSLIEYLENKPEVFKNILKKRKQEELEQSGFLSLIKIKFLKSLQGSNYTGDEVSLDEVQKKLDDLKDGMIMAYNYAQESKGRRFSKRLAAKRQKVSQSEKENVRTPKISKMTAVLMPPVHSQTAVKVPPMPPPPPPCPPPMITPLKERHLTSTPHQVLSRPPLRRNGDPNV